jgi:hypothetical protein
MAHTAWNPKKEFVEQKEYNTSDFVKGSHFLLMLPVKKDTGGSHYYIVKEFTEADDLVPVGMIQNLSLNQSKQLQRFFEIGSDLSDFAEGMVSGNLSIAKLQMNTGNLLKYFNFIKSSSSPDEFYDATTKKNKVIFSMLTQLFSNEVSLIIAMYGSGTQFDTTVGTSSGGTATTGLDNIGEYPKKIIELKDVLLGSYSLSLSSNNVMVAENLQFTFTRINPINEPPKSSETQT